MRPRLRRALFLGNKDLATLGLSLKSRNLLPRIMAIVGLEKALSRTARSAAGGAGRRSLTRTFPGPIVPYPGQEVREWAGIVGGPGGASTGP